MSMKRSGKPLIKYSLFIQQLVMWVLMVGLRIFVLGPARGVH